MKLKYIQIERLSGNLLEVKKCINRKSIHNENNNSVLFILLTFKNITVMIKQRPKYRTLSTNESNITF